MTTLTEKSKVITRQVSWEEVDNHAREIATAFKDHEVNSVIAVGRGGYVPAVIISHQLQAPLVPIVWQNRDGDDRTNLSTILEALNDGDTILVVDDISDSGMTMGQIVGALMHLSIKLKKRIEVLTCAVHQKAKSSFITHKFGEWVDDNTWIVYPWEKE
jgi:hypoxanthine phosphoribosyltransferase